MPCVFCGHSTPHVCWTAEEAAGCGNYAASREHQRARQQSAAAVDRVIKARTKRPTAKQIETAERAELARLKKKYERTEN